ncbi:MAG TPA: adenylate/guanylate cyclase domain-containing protein [Acidimicrobiia bacterium]|jgi:class 3 adenylate cyclase|nr:adenylate/guanylate cyclase domain-containing protein [Acidimicrobiia bacterium]
MTADSWLPRLQRLSPATVDWIMAVLLAGAVTAAITVAPEQGPGEVRLAYLLGPVLGALSLVRRRRPVAVLLSSTAALVFYNQFDTPGMFAAIPLSVALATAWAEGHRAWCLLVAVVLGVIPIVYVSVTDLPPSFEEEVERGAVSDIALMAAVLFLGEALRARRALAAEQERSEALLLNILPASIADRLKARETVIADRFSEVTVMFVDLVDFTASSDGVEPAEVVNDLDDLFTVFDELAERHGLEKIKTIGDAYMVAGGLPEPRADHAEAVAEMALAVQDVVSGRTDPGGRPLAARIGIDTGPVVAGVIGRHKFSYDLWGDTVNTASRMESQGVPGMIQVTDRTYRRLRDEFRFEHRGSIDVKGKGKMETWFLLSSNDGVRVTPPQAGSPTAPDAE